MIAVLKNGVTKTQNVRVYVSDGEFQTVVGLVGEGENKVKIGGGNFCMNAGPCSVESEEQIIEVAKDVQAMRDFLTK